jgi:hypothetical protein
MATSPDLITQAADPLTPPAQLATMAHQHADLRAAIAANPAAYDGLLEWLGGLGEPAVDAALALRKTGKSGSALPPPPPPPPAATAATVTVVPPGTPWVEPSHAIPLTWGTYPLHYGLGLALFIVGALLALQFSLLSDLVAAIALAGAIVIMPSTTPAKVRAAAFGAGALLVVAVLSGGIYGLGFYLLPLVVASWLASWLSLRMRPGVSFALLPIALLTIGGGRLLFGNLFIVLLLLIGAGIAWLARLVAARRRPTVASAPLAAPGSVSSTNVLAILALVFGIGGGLLGIIFGHTARAQIRRTGEQGWGLATAGLVLGYLGLGASVVILIVYAVVFITASR